MTTRREGSRCRHSTRTPALRLTGKTFLHAVCSRPPSVMPGTREDNAVPLLHSDNGLNGYARRSTPSVMPARGHRPRSTDAGDPFVGSKLALSDKSEGEKPLSTTAASIGEGVARRVTAAAARICGIFPERGKPCG
ncbi:hypothetical protein MRX96_001140 [Rhipicephalus microplus]